MTEIALITGASSGIGVGIAKVLAAKVLTRHNYSHNQQHIYIYYFPIAIIVILTRRE